MDALVVSPPEFACVVAAEKSRGIGRNGRLPWPRLPADIGHLRDITTRTRAVGARNAVILGRKSWESVPPRFRPLPDRLNIVVTRGALSLPPQARVATSLDGAIAAALDAAVESIFVLGGGQLFATAVADPRCQIIYYTRIDAHFAADTYFPAFEVGFERDPETETHHEAGVRYDIERWRRRTEASSWTC